MNIKHLRIYLFGFLLINLLGCIDPYEIDFTQKNNVLVVEGFLTDNYLNPDTIKIQYSSFQDGGNFITTIASIKASIVAQGTGTEIKLVEQKLGGFLPPNDFRINPAEKYFLRFSLPNGQQYESNPEQILTSPPILNTYDKFNPKSRLSDDGKTILSANEVYLDFQDIPNQKNFYMWRYTHYERNLYCTTCYNNTEYDTRTKDCTIKLPQFIRTPYYDYRCITECFAILRGRPINVMSDAVSEGKVVSGRLIAKIPYFSSQGCLVTIQQMGISLNAYNYFSILQSQSQSTGGLADTPPAAIVGNINNVTNSTEKVVGYFAVVSVQEKKYWVDRKTGSGTFDYLLGHLVIEEPSSSNDPSRPPFVPCIKSATRTPIKPDGWQ